jgi:formylglycine-generating enzyme required for sulfatase activity
VDLITIPEGWFWRGAAGGSGQDDERPRRRIWVDSFRLARTQVTNAEYEKFLNATGHVPTKFWGQPDFSHPQAPVVGPSWHDATAYCRWLGPEFRLPTEAEWERAARGHLEDALYPWGDEPPASRPDYHARWRNAPEPIDTSPANGLGLDAMGENVHEWCADSYDPGYYTRSPDRNPCCEDNTARKASRGGSWRHHIKIARCSARSSIPPEFQYADYGFRVAAR